MAGRIERVVLLVLDSCGCGAAPDAERYGDAGADTFGHLAAAVGGLAVPNLQALGLGNLAGIAGVPPAEAPRAAFGRLQERSAGKDTTTGHWEMAGLVTAEPFRTFPQGFPPELIDPFVEETGRGVLGNIPASGTAIIEQLGPRQLQTGEWIVYTSADSVLQIAAHEQEIPLEELYAACKIARRLCDPWHIGRVIARPFVGQPGAFERTYNRHDYGMRPPGRTMLDQLQERGKPVIGVGKIGDIFSEVGLSASIRTAGNADGLHKTVDQLKQLGEGLIFVNLIDFDSLYGHRRDPQGFAAALQQLDALLPQLTEQIGERDLLIITADHGNDPTYGGTDHTREQVPLLVYGPKAAGGKDLGLRDGFFDISATVIEAFGAEALPVGRSFLRELLGGSPLP